MKNIYVVNAYKENLGDYLIFKSFLNNVSSIHDHLNILELHIKELNEYKFAKNSVLIFPGGPLLNNNLKNKNLDYGKFFQKALKNEILIILFGVGLGVDFNFEMGFNEHNRKILQSISEFSPVFCRDNITYEYLKKNNINSEVSGCPVLNFEITNNLNNFQNKTLISDPGFRNSSRLLYFFIFCIKLINKESKNGNVEFLFNANFLSKDGASRKKYYTQQLLIKYLKLKKIKILKGKEILENNKLFSYKKHIGFRVHTHLLFLANNLDSTLISEDIRGVGQIELFNTYKQELPKVLRNINNYIGDEIVAQKNTKVIRYKDLNIQTLKHLKF